jgi:hypothetical protein
MMSLHDVALKAQTRFTKKFGSKGQIPLSGSDMNMTKIGCQLRRQELYVSPAAIPCDEPVNDSGVPQIVKTGLITGTIVPQNAGTIPHAPEGVLSNADGDRTTIPAGKYGRIWLARIRPAAICDELTKSLGQVRSHWDQPRLIKLALANAQHRLLEIQISRRQ